MRRPDFFIVGAPKCGTTWLHHYLCMHPDVFMPTAKEPHHFNTDSDFRWYPQRDAYEDLFASVPEQARAIGEASVWYLHSRVAVANILDYQPNARFIAMVRNPLDMAPSMHQQLLFNQYEDVADFATSWALQGERAAGRHLPRQCVSAEILQYRSTCALGEQIERLFATAGRERVQVIVHDDLRDHPVATFRAALDFLGLPAFVPPAMGVVNAATERRSPWLKRAVSDLAQLKQRLGLHGSFGLLNRLNRWNARPAARTTLSPALRIELANAFAADVARLGTLLDRPLGHWLAPPGEPAA